MRTGKRWFGIIFALVCALSLSTTTYAGWEMSGGSWHYRDVNNSYALSQWVNDSGNWFYLNERGVMEVSTTTPDGYLVGADGRWVQERQENGNYVRTPYDNQPYYYDPNWEIYVFDEETDYAWVTDTRVLAAVRGILPATELSEKQYAVYEEVCRFLEGFDYGASDYEKAKRVYEEINGRAVYNDGTYEQADDEVYSILITGKGKCVGFARTYKLLANAVGLKCGFRENGAHMWNGVYIDGAAKGIDASTIGTSAEFYLDKTNDICPSCGYENTFGARESARLCFQCGTQIYNPKFN